MRLPYSRELQELPETLASAARADIEHLREALLQLGREPVRFVGTGGTLTLARLAADLHERSAKQPARVMTPLEFVQAPRLARCGVGLFSARARHPDALLALAEMTSGGYSQAVLITHRDPSEIEAARATDLRVIQVAKPGVDEGFLATNSVLAMSAALLRAHGALLPPDVLDSAERLAELVPVDRDQLLVLHPPNLAPVAIDVETRLSELGLCAVQVSDLRNVAHGRHTGLARNARRTAVLTLSDRASRQFADAVDSIVSESGSAHARWHADLDGGPATIRLLAASMHLAQRFATAQGFDPARPSVPMFGRRLYNQPIRRFVRRVPQTPIARKMAALGAGELPDGLREEYSAAYETWRSDLASVAFGGVVLDYDGTVCRTSRRLDPPDSLLRAELVTLLESGIVLGFASGRGRSLHAGLRTWIPIDHWDRVVTGMYNGAVRLLLSEEIGDLREPSALMSSVHERLENSILRHMLVMEPRTAQVTVEARSQDSRVVRLAELVRDILAQTPSLPVKVVASGHSLDIVEADTTKVDVLRHVQDLVAGEVLVVGDQGDLGGNDFEMLSATRWSISVDQCSADPTRCWPVDSNGRRGPEALLGMLRSLRVLHSAAHLPVPRKAARRA